jgi:hypothetical protein
MSRPVSPSSDSFADADRGDFDPRAMAAPHQTSSTADAGIAVATRKERVRETADITA